MIKTLWVIILAGCLTACQTVHHTQAHETETIVSWFSANKQAYAIGDKRVYQLDAASTAQLVDLYQQPVLQKALMDFARIGINQDNQQVDVIYTVYFDAHRLTDADRAILKQYPLFNEQAATYFNTLTLFRQEWLKLPTPKPTHLVRIEFSQLKGKVVQLQNQQEILAQGRLTRPVASQVSHYRTSVAWSESGKHAVTVASAPIWIPVASILFLPYLVVCKPNLLSGKCTRF